MLISPQIRVLQQPHHRKGLAERQRTGRKAVAQIVHSNVVQTGPGPDIPPHVVETAAAETTFPVVAGKHPRAVLTSRQRLQKPHRRRRELHDAGSGLGVRWMEDRPKLPDYMKKNAEYLFV